MAVTFQYNSGTVHSYMTTGSSIKISSGIYHSSDDPLMRFSYGIANFIYDDGKESYDTVAHAIEIFQNGTCSLKLQQYSDIIQHLSMVNFDFLLEINTSENYLGTHPNGFILFENSCMRNLTYWENSTTNCHPPIIELNMIILSSKISKGFM